MKPESNRIFEYAIDFFVGGSLIALTLLITDMLGPAIGGEFAALPIRIGSTIFIGGLRGGEAVAYEMTKGAFSGIVGAFSFSLVLSYLPSRIGVYRSIVLAAIVCLSVIAVTRPIILGLLS